MDFKVDYEEIDKIGGNVETEVDNLELKRKEMLQILEDLSNCWQGDDYNEFKENAKTYLDNLKIKIEELQYMSGFMRYASERYSNNDNKWGKRIKQYGEEEKLWELQEK